MKNILKKLNINVILSLLFSYLTLFALIKLNYVSNYNMFTLLFFIILYYLYKDINIIKNINKNNICLIMYSSIVSLILIIGYYTYLNMYNNEISILKEIIKLNNLFIFLGIYPLIYSIIIKFTNYIEKIKNNNLKISNKMVFFISFASMAFIWIIYYLAFFPGILTPDSIDQMTQIINGLKELSNHHPVFHTFYMFVPFKIGELLFGSVNAGVACISLIQIVILASVFSYMIMYLYKEKCNKYILLIILIFYAFSSIFGFYSITLWKDVLFGAIILLFTIVIYKIIKKENQLTKKNYIELFIISLLCMLIRNNGLYIIIFITPVIFFSLKNKKICLPLFLSIILYLIISGPIFNVLNIGKSSSKEYIAIPLQQIGRMAYKNANFTKEEKEYLKTIISVKDLRENYEPMNVDSIKFNKKFNIQGFDKDKLKFINIWSRLVIKHPTIAIESYLVSTLGYWYPNVNFWSIGTGVYENNIGIEYKEILPKSIKNKLLELESRETPLFGFQWSIGSCLLIILYLAIYNIHTKKYKLLLCFLPVFGVWVTLMIASPVFAEFRYIFSAFTTIPFLVGITCINNKKI